ncbi:glycoside hydrolase 100 family protein [bacterium]|nr:glycoside hydrolase 100 family protein [bacterium]
MLEQGGTNDWADLMPRHGTVFYTNALWCKVLELYGFKKERKLAIDGLNNLFLPFSAEPKKSKFLQKDIYKIELLNDVKKTVKKKEYYLNYVSTQYGNDRCDVYGNILAVLFSVASQDRKEKIINYFIKEKISEFYPIKVFFPPIKKEDEDWKEFLKHCKLNYPNQYHNGGIWPYVGGFWAILLYKSGRKKLGFEVLKNLAKANKINNWEFNEWFHGVTKKPMGMKGQSWNAGMFILAYHYLKNNFKF